MGISATGAMDPHEKLKAARNIKEEGNDYFKRGKLPEAQKSYTKVLDMLREEIPFTGDDQKKERQSLILAAHLNLAQCALQLGDNVKVIDHCNTALSLDSNNVKAHFRKTKAFENLSEYAKALEGYQTVLRLEPNNSAAQKQQSECREKVDTDRCTGSVQEISSLAERQEPDHTEDDDMEIVDEYFEGVFESRYEKCKKNPGHKAFINVKDFVIDQLPLDYRDEELFDLVKLQIQLTVLLEVRGSSERRPDIDTKSGGKYPFSGKRFRTRTRRGSGWVKVVHLNKAEQLCPCTICQSSGFPEKRWAEIHIATARHVVYDEIEGKNTFCYFFYDAEVPLESCPSVGHAATHYIQDDENILKYISHNQRLIDFLYNASTLYNMLFFKVNKKYNGDTSVNDLRNILENLIQRNQSVDKSLSDFRDALDRLMTICNGDPATEFQKCLVKDRKTGMPSQLSQLLLDKLNGGNELQKNANRLLKMYDIVHKAHSFVSKKIDHCVEKGCRGDLSVIEESKHAIHQWNNTVSLMERAKNILLHLMPHEEKDFCLPQALDNYNKAHPLTIIVSHPHGCSKKISVGKVTSTSTECQGLFARFTHSVPTCPGTSGAFVFVLGQKTFFMAPPHSGGGSVGGRQQNLTSYSTL